NNNKNDDNKKSFYRFVVLIKTFFFFLLKCEKIFLGKEEEEEKKEEEKEKKEKEKEEEEEEKKNKYNKSERYYAGLVNAGATCYMNSILQTLFHIPFLRKSIFEIAMEITDCMLKHKDICYEFQSLFMKMEEMGNNPTEYCSAVTTADLMESFGWDNLDAFDQHDVQEFLRILLEALEHKLKGTNCETLIQDLFQGEWETVIECKDVKHCSARQEFFHDISLNVTPSSSSSSSSSPKQRSYNNNDSHHYSTCLPICTTCPKRTKAFRLKRASSSENKYYANDTLGKQDAHKYIRFLKLPTVLVVHLKRFAFNASSVRPTKITSSFKFKQKLNLNRFVYDPHSQSSSVNNNKNDNDNDATIINIKNEDLSMDDKDNIKDTNSWQGYSHVDIETGPYRYRLYSVLVHNGSTNRGHYYAILSPQCDNMYYRFNDEDVSLMKHEWLQSCYRGLCSAYLLVYIREDKIPELFSNVNLNNDIPLPAKQNRNNVESRVLEETERMNEEKRKLQLFHIHGHGLMDFLERNTPEIHKWMTGLPVLQWSKHVKIAPTLEAFSNAIQDWSREYDIPVQRMLLYHFSDKNLVTEVWPESHDFRTLLCLLVLDTAKVPHIFGDPSFQNLSISSLKSENDAHANVVSTCEHAPVFEQGSRVEASRKQRQQGCVLLCVKYFDIWSQKLEIIGFVLIDKEATLGHWAEQYLMNYLFFNQDSTKTVDFEPIHKHLKPWACEKIHELRTILNHPKSHKRVHLQKFVNQNLYIYREYIGIRNTTILSAFDSSQDEKAQ
ncbi:hypothetical protein RFI_11573, partial [Reticulomyxa filosa]